MKRRLHQMDHSSQILSGLTNLLDNDLLLDCTILCEDQVIRAHKVVLSAASDYFKTAFSTLSPPNTFGVCQNTGVIIRDMPFDDLRVLIDFIYTGDVSVESSRIPQVIRAAESLKLRGFLPPQDSQDGQPQNKPNEETDEEVMEATSDMKIPSTSIVPRTPTPVKQKFLVQESFASSPIICQALMAGKNPCSASVLSQSLLDNPSKNRLSIPSVSPSFFKEEHETQRALMSPPISEKECQGTRGSIRLNNRQPHSPSHIHSNQDSYSSGEDDSASISKSSSKNRSSFDLSPNLRRGSDGSDVKDYRSPTPPALRHKHPFKPRDFFGNKLYHESYTTCIFEKELLRHQETHNCKSPSKLRDSSPLERTSNSSLQQCIQDDRDYSVLRSTSSVNNHAFPGNVIESHPLKQTTTAPLSVRSPFQSHHHQKDFSSQVNRSISVSSRHSSDAIIGDVMHAGLKRGRGRPPRHSVDDDFGMRIASEKNHYIDEICQESINNLNAMKEGRTMSPGSSMILSQTDSSDFMIKRIRVSSDGSTASIRGRRPKLTSSREVHGKNKCPHCPQVYYSTQAMNDHINNVHSKNATKYHCKQCSKEFSWKISLNKHLRKQHGHHLPESLSQKHRLSSSMRSLGSPKNGSPVSLPPSLHPMIEQPQVPSASL